MRVVVTGGRDYTDADAINRELTALHREARHDCMVVVQGGASGADRLALKWCARNFLTCWNVPADWSRHGGAAGPMRNREMLTERRPDIVIAFPGGQRTADCVRQARSLGIPVKEVAR